MFSIIKKLWGHLFGDTTIDTSVDIERNQYTQTDQTIHKEEPLSKNISEKKVETTKDLRSIYESILKIKYESILQ